MTTNFTTAIVARDFTTSTKDPNRDRWSVGAMQHVVAALAGQPVAVVLDAMSGHTAVGVRLVAAFEGGPSRGPRVTVEYDLSDGTVQSTHHYLYEVGAVIPLNEGPSAKGYSTKGAKWVALDTWREQANRAIAKAQAEHGDVHNYGKWTIGYRDGDRVHVSYEPQREGAGKHAWWEVSVPAFVTETA